jgi:transketolase
MEIPQTGSNLKDEHVDFLNSFARSCRRSIIEMVKNAQSGHPGGSLSTIDYLSLIYTFIVSRTGEDVVVSNGHISPAVYSVLAELKYTDKEKAIEEFRQVGKIYEGHISRHVPGVLYGTGPLGIGVSVAAAKAWAHKYNKEDKKVFGIMGDGETQEGQVHEFIHFSKKYRLDNLIMYVDYNKVQLTASLEDIMPLDIAAMYKAGGWHVIEADAHNYRELWQALNEAHKVTGRPTVILGHSIMGKGVSFMEEDGKAHKATWHGSAPKPEKADKALEELKISDEDKKRIEEFIPKIKWRPAEPEFPDSLTPIDINTGDPVVYDADTVTDCRSAYGAALFDLAKNNKNIIAITADLRGSVKTQKVAEEIPKQHVECGIAEQHMASFAGGLSLTDFIPFPSTFGAFMTSRAKDQARVNDINNTNVKMVSTHCGLSVGEDGPTHQVIDDMGGFAGLLNTMVIEPADANQTDRIIRYIASRFGNFYVRMGRHKFPVIKKEDGSVFYDKNYKYEYGKTDVIREGSDITIVATGAMVNESLKAVELLKESDSKISVELVAASSIKKFDDTLLESVKKTKKVITVEDHNTYNGLGASLAGFLNQKGICPDKFKSLGVKEYQLSGKPEELYAEAGIDKNAIADACISLN